MLSRGHVYHDRSRLKSCEIKGVDSALRNRAWQVRPTEQNTPCPLL